MQRAVFARLCVLPGIFRSDLMLYVGHFGVKTGSARQTAMISDREKLDKRGRMETGFSSITLLDFRRIANAPIDLGSRLPRITPRKR